MTRQTKTILLTESGKPDIENYLINLQSELNSTDFCVECRSCGVTKDIKFGDRAFLLLQGRQTPGIVACGWVLTDAYEDIHWNDPQKTALYVLVSFDVIINPFQERHLERERLLDGILGTVRWNTQSSGVSVYSEAAKELELLWKDVSGKDSGKIDPEQLGAILDKFIKTVKSFNEGSSEPPEKVQVVSHRFDRNRSFSDQIKTAYDFVCQRCGYIIENSVGARYAESAHVHPLEYGGCDTIDNLLCLCPNCHKELDLGCWPLSVGEFTFVDGHKLKNEVVDFHNCNLYTGRTFS